MPYVYYKCEDNLANTTVVDNSGNLNGTASTNTSNLSVSGKLNLGFELNGTDERISLNGSSLPLGANARTVTCWIKYTVNDSAYRNIFNYGITGSNNQLFSIYIYQGKIGFTQWGTSLETTSLYNDGNWHFVSVVYDGTTAYLRVDNNTPLSGAMTVNTPTGTTAYIGYSLYLGSYLACTIDNFQIYTEVLSNSALDMLYNSGNGTEEIYGQDILTGGTSSSSSDYSAGYESDKAADNNLTTRWSSAIDESSSWWKYDLGSGVTKTVTKLCILGHYHPSYGLFIKNFILKGSNDNSNWTTIYSGVCTNTGNGDGVSTLNNIWQIFAFSNSTAYRYYKLDGMNDHYTSVIAISVIEFEMMELFITEEIYPVIWTDRVGVSVNLNSLTKTASTAWGNSGGASTQILTGDCKIEFTINELAKARLCGLSLNNTDANYDTINFAVGTDTSNNIYVFENGTPYTGFGTVIVTDVLSVERVGTTIYYKKNGSALYTSTVSSSGNLLIDCALYDNGGTITNALITGNLLNIDGDNHTKLLLHCDGNDGSISFPDASDSAHSVTAQGNAQVDTAQSKFGGASTLFDGTTDYLSLLDSDDWNFNDGDFTIDLWVRFNTVGINQALCSQTDDGNNRFNLIWQSDGSIAFYCAITGVAKAYYVTPNLSPSINIWYHVALVRYATNIYIFFNGVSQSLTVINAIGTNDLGNRSSNLNIGYDTFYSLWSVDGWIDEYRISKGLARWIENFTPPIEAYSPITESIGDTITLQDTWLIQTNPEQAQIVDTVTLQDTWLIQQNPTLIDISDTITLTDTWLIDRSGIFKTKYLTKLYTTLQIVNTYFTDLRTVFNSTKKYATKLYTQVLQKNIYKTDLRVRVTPIDEVVVGTLDDFLVKLDGVELEDVDYNTLNITYNLNTTPSTADFVLARRHDNLDVMLNGNPSVITAENKIEVFDGTRKLFTGYISEIDADSVNDTVRVVAADCRLKLSRASMELKYGGVWQADANHNGIPDDEDETNDKSFDEPDYIKFEKNIYTSFIEVMTAVGSLVSGYDSLPFSGSFVPEYVKIEKDYASLIDDLIRQTANCNWYIDENERLRFQKIGSGAIKALPLASLNVKRHPYDLILNNVQLNKITSNYTKSLVVKRGKDIIQHWSTRTFAGWINQSFFNFMKSLKEKTSFVFHSVKNQPPIYYTGVNGTAISYYVYGSWRSYPTIIVQWEDTNTSYNLPDITVGSGLPKKTLHLTSYGKKVSNLHYAELIKSGENPNNSPSNPPISDKTYFCEITDENYNNSSFVLDLANFELSQNNKTQSSANLSLLLDAYEYYNISFSDLINLSNTIQSGIYSNNNGFPLNIDSVRINCATRTVDLSLTNSGKSWYAKTGSCLKNYTQPKVTYVQPKVIWTVVTEQSGTFTTE